MLEEEHSMDQFTFPVAPGDKVKLDTIDTRYKGDLSRKTVERCS